MRNSKSPSRVLTLLSLSCFLSSAVMEMVADLVEQRNQNLTSHKPAAKLIRRRNIENLDLKTIGLIYRQAIFKLSSQLYKVFVPRCKVLLLLVCNQFYNWLTGYLTFEPGDVQ